MTRIKVQDELFGNDAGVRSLGARRRLFTRDLDPEGRLLDTVRG